MRRKLLLLAGLLIMMAWSSSVLALGDCTCKFCFPGSHASCWFDGGVITCGDYRLNNC